MSDLGPLASGTPQVTVTASTPSTPAPTGNAQTGGAQTPAPVTPGGTAPQTQTPSSPTPSSPTTVLQGSSDATEIASSASELAKGGQINAQVVARDNSALLVRTAAGNTLALTNLAQAFEQANVAVLNAAIKLALNPENPQQATVVNVNGTALQPPLTATAQPPTAAQLALAASPPQPGAASAAPVLPQAGQTLNATVVAPQTSAAPANALPTGSQLQVVVQSVTLPAAAAPTVTTPTAPAATPGAATPTASAATPAATTPNAAATPLPSGAAPAAAPAAQPSITSVLVQAQVQAQPVPTAATPAPVLPQGQPPVLPAALQQAAAQAAASPLNSAAVPTQSAHGQLLTGVVTGQGQGGQVQVATSQGVLSLNLPQPLPPGTQISFELAALTKPAPVPGAATPSPPGAVLTRLQGEWPALQQTLDAVRAADPALGQRLQELLPQPNSRLAATALQFMAAAAAGNAQAWLGRDAVRRLEQEGKGDLLKKLDDDFREMGKLNQRQGDNDWQALVMPMMIGGKVEAIQIFMRRRKDPKKQQKQTRFIIDFDLESTGPIQFDGFVGSKQLDLILRSETTFGPAFRLDVTAIFEEALAVTGMSGSLRFHDREKPLPWPSPELEARGPSTVIKA